MVKPCAGLNIRVGIGFGAVGHFKPLGDRTDLPGHPPPRFRAVGAPSPHAQVTKPPVGHAGQCGKTPPCDFGVGVNGGAA